jgi:ribosome-associated translation inhibitor RaiA
VCDVELSHDAHHQKGDVCMAEVTLEVNGTLHRSTKMEPKLEKAIDKVKDDILASLRTEKGKHEDSVRKGAAEAKAMLRSQ